MNKYQIYYNQQWALMVSLKQDYEQETDPEIRAATMATIEANETLIARIIEGGKIAGQPVKQN